jgi:hypothetical protein
MLSVLSAATVAELAIEAVSPRVLLHAGGH